jgi:LCP family protein required for cell wall assembly
MTRPGGRGAGGWHALSRPARAACVGVSVLALLILVAGLGGYGVYRHLDGNISQVDVSGLSHRSVYGVQNILLLGSQTRDGQGKGFGSNPSLDTSNSDNLLLVHLDATHTHAIVVSIPRDTMVYEPGCPARPSIGDGIWGPYQSAIIDGAMNIGGPSCAVATVSALTGITLDHFVMFNFNSFRAMVQALGGVQVCVPASGYHDPYSGLNLPGGLHELNYSQALAYVRTRHGVEAEGDVGGDLPRIELQQAFMSSVIQQVNSQGVLSNAGRLLSIANTATQALTVDQGLGSASKLLGLARSLTGLPARNVTMMTLPTVPDPDPGEAGRLLPLEPADDVIFQMLLDGQDWPGHLPVQPDQQVSVRVLNGTGTGGLASQTAAQLARLGFRIAGTGNAPATATTTVTYTGTAQADSAYTLMSALTATPAAQNLMPAPAPQAGAPGTITLTVGADFAGVHAPAPAARPGSRPARPPGDAATTAGAGPAAQAPVQVRNAAANICSGLPAANPDPGEPPGN